MCIRRIQCWSEIVLKRVSACDSLVPRFVLKVRHCLATVKSLCFGLKDCDCCSLPGKHHFFAKREPRRFGH